MQVLAPLTRCAPLPQEICLLKSLNYDRNIVQFYGARLKHGAAPMMVLEFMEVGLDVINISACPLSNPCCVNMHDFRRLYTRCHPALVSLSMSFCREATFAAPLTKTILASSSGG